MTERTPVDIEELELPGDDLDVARAAEIYSKHGCLVVRGLLKSYVPRIAEDIECSARQALSMLDRAGKVPEGWRTPDGTLFIPAPESFARDRQIMVLSFSYLTSAAFFHSALDNGMLDLVQAVLGPDIELFGHGQCLYKEPAGGHPKHLHQDNAYFEHRYEGPMAALTYVVPTRLDNGALYVVPGSHRLGRLKHVDTFSHLGLDAGEWPWESAVPICGEPGDSIFFHVRTIHGSKENRSASPRPVFIHRYRRADDYVVISATSTENRKAAEKNAARAGKENQWGLLVRGRRSWDSGRA